MSNETEDTILIDPKDMPPSVLAAALQGASEEAEGRRAEILAEAARRIRDRRPDCSTCRRSMHPVKKDGDLLGYVCPVGHESVDIKGQRGR